MQTQFFHCCAWQREECFAFSYFGVVLLDSTEKVLLLKNNYSENNWNL